MADHRTPVTLGASLKLYLDVDASIEWAAALRETAQVHPSVISGDVRLFVLPSLPALSAVIDVLAGSPIAVGAQDLFWEDRGAYTGGVSGVDLARLGCTYVEVGHVERRRIFNEDDLTIRLKFAAALRNGLTPVLCVGETAQINAESAAQLCIAQLDSAMSDSTGLQDLVVAYEPEWAIGQAEPAPSAHVVAVIEKLRQHVDELGLADAAVIYGGSAKPGLLRTLGGGVDGLFLGRFAHDPAAFASIIDEAAGLR
ncbi:MAG: triose-phosphate isomerase family protein [Rhodoglobus sp.]